ncbi:MAG: hypothetical protein ACI4XF_02530 [Oscillospiraceae bacterium]
MGEDNIYRNRAMLLIEAVYGKPPSEESDLYPFYSQALDIQSELMEKQNTSSGLKRLSLGDYSEEYSQSDSSSDELIAPAARAMLAAVYPRAEVTVVS